MDMLKVIQSVAAGKRTAFTQSPIGEFAVLGALLLGTQLGLSNLGNPANSDLTNNPVAPQANAKLLTPPVVAPKVIQLEPAQIETLVDLINPTATAETERTASASAKLLKLKQADISHNDSIARFVFNPKTSPSLIDPATKAAMARVAGNSANRKFHFKTLTGSKLGQSADANIFATSKLASKTLAIWDINQTFSLADKRQKTAATKKRKPNDKFVIMLDPGHGGSDPGSVGHNGLLEKALTLEIAKRTALFLSEIDNIEVLLTRNSDTGLSRKNRVKKVKQSKADMVVSLHLNHLPQTDINLVETFYAAPHNIMESIEKQRAEKNPNGLVKTTAKYNHDFGFTKGSRQLATLMQKRVFDEVAHDSPNTDNAGVKEDMLYILTRSFTPGVLIEMSCLSNVQEAKRLADPAYRDRLAAALADGIRDYLSTPEAKRHLGPEV